ncbi:hypothetical protein OIO90_004789 [Microbotryomycetes sp. JL221]|nr:hypothetical protein OIO90_004789 [Microbotryomycetes sp. JL221]
MLDDKMTIILTGKCDLLQQPAELHQLTISVVASDVTRRLQAHPRDSASPPSGCNVTAMSRSETPELVDLADTYKGALNIFKGDVAKDGDNKEAVDVTLAAFQRVDALILNAGTLDPLGTTEGLTGKLDKYKTLFDVNFFSLVSIVQHALPHLRERSKHDVSGRIIMVSSGAATGGVAGWGPYSASKAAMNSFVRTLGNEEPSIVSVAVRPGVVDTAMQEAIRSTGGQHMTEKDHARFTGLHAEGKLVPPEQPGAVLAALSLKATKDLTGQFVSWDSDEMQAYSTL